MSDDNNNHQNPEQDSAAFVIDFAQVEEVSNAFFEESKEILEELDNLILKLEENPHDLDHINVLFRKVHTIKGSVGAVPGGQLMGSLAHEFEALLTQIKREGQSVNKECIDLFLKSSRIMKVLAKRLREKSELYPEELSEAIELISHYANFDWHTGAPTSRTSKPRETKLANSEEQGVWLSLNQLNEFLRLSGELLVLKNFFQMMNQTVNFRTHPELFERRQTDFSQSLTKISDQFQSQVQSVRKEKASESFQGLHLLVRQASTELNKNVHLEVHGGDLMIDKGLGQDLHEALVHIVRNSIDHGIEDQFERALQGKSPIGNLSLDVSEKNNTVIVEYRDDGKGLDKERILEKAVRSGFVTEDEASRLSEEEIYRFIFSSGLSTKDKVTTMSGRGVGMDIVLAIVEKYQGKIHIENKMGHGVCFKIEIPVPQYIMVENALLCSWSQFQMAVPLASVAHISSCSELQMTTVDHLRFCQFNGLTVPLLNYGEMLHHRLSATPEQVQTASAVFIKVKDNYFALLVDRIEAQTDLVVKSFGKIIEQQKGFKGISILADEKVTYIVDPEKMFEILFQLEMMRDAA